MAGEAGRLAMALTFWCFSDHARFLRRQLRLRCRRAVSIATNHRCNLGGLGIARVSAGSTVVRRECWWCSAGGRRRLQFFAGMRRSCAPDDGAWAARADVQFAKSLVPELRFDS